jgi:hypothetical protein
MASLPRVIEYPWPDSRERTESRVSGLVAGVVEPGELRFLRLEWVTPWAHHCDRPDAAWVALRLTVAGIDDHVYQQEIWGPDWPLRSAPGSTGLLG